MTIMILKVFWGCQAIWLEMILNHYEIFESLNILLWLYEGGYIFFPSLIRKKLSKKQYEQENTEKIIDCLVLIYSIY